MSTLRAVPAVSEAAVAPRAHAMERSRNSSDASSALSVGDLMTTAQVAMRCQVPVSTIRTWRMTGYGPEGFAVGRHVRYPVAVVETWLVEKREADRAQRAVRRRVDLRAS